MSGPVDRTPMVRAAVDERRLMARSLAYMWAAGSTLLMATLALPHAAAEHRVALIVIVVAGYAVAGTMLGVRGLPAAAFEGITALGTALISAVVVLDAVASSPYALFLVWLAVHAFYFLPWRRATAQLAFMVVVYGVALLVAPSHHDEREVRFAMEVGTLVVTAAFVGLLKARVDRLVVRLSDAARRDFLTGLLNRRGFEDALDLELERVQRGDRPLSLLLIDIDHFKLVNDRYGHHVGDATLVTVAGALDGVRRRIDTVARTGGEEFVLLLPDTDARGAFLVAERLRREVRAATDAPPVTVSVGLAAYPGDGREAGLLLKAADQALYAAKGLGRDRSVVYSPNLHAVLAEAAERHAGRSAIELATALALADALDLRDEGAAQHSRIVGRYAELAARELGLDDAHVERVRLAGLLHDVGKIGIADTILHKTGPLDAGEWEQMRTHPEIGARLLAGDDVADIRAWVLAHHERPDGTGYPRGLAGDAIPLEARILAVADAYEAMTTDRVYRPAIGAEAAAAELRLGVGTQFDGAVVDALLTALRRRRCQALPAAA